jgi:hypothetical protein
MRIAVLVTLVFMPLVIGAQEYGATIRGTMTGPEGERVLYMWIRAMDAGNEAEVSRTETLTDGTYTLGNLPAGEYVLEVGTPCCAYLPYKSEPFSIEHDQVVVHDIALEEGGSFNTVGDDPGVIAAALRSEAVIPDAPVPQLSGDMPDFSGVWVVAPDPFPETPAAHPWAQTLLDERVANHGIDHPHNDCLPAGPPIAGGTSPFIAKFVHKEDLLVILMEDYPGFRQVFVDGRDHPDYVDPSWMGHSIAHWEADTLVVDTIGFNDRGWLDFWPRSEELRVTERYTRPEFGRLELAVTIEDPKVFERPWSKMMTLHLVPQEELIEYVCENNKW